MPGLTPVDPVKGQVPSKLDVEKFHTNADTNGSDGSIHHTLGPRKGNAAPGDHDHRGGNSVQLMSGDSISGSRSDATSAGALAHLLQYLSTEFGLTDNTTA